jgi:sialate O-acetylesterase
MFYSGNSGLKNSSQNTNYMKKYGSYISFVIFFFSFSALAAKVQLPAVFSDNMVLQQKSSVPFWGTATPGKILKITTSWNNKTIQTAVTKDGSWKTDVPTPVYGGPFNIEITDGTKLELRNVMIGEVWLCSGQSNMEMPLAGWGKIMNYEKEIAEANYADIRLLRVEKSVGFKPAKELLVRNKGWVTCSPQTIPEFSAVAYFFGRNLYQHLHIPIGLIDASWGGTIAEAWTSSGSLKTMPDFTSSLIEMDRKAANFNNLTMKFKQDSTKWQALVKEKDRGLSNGNALWATNDMPEIDWNSIKVPGFWEGTVLPDFDGVVWLRKTIDIPADWQNKPLTLKLDKIDDADITYYNGVEIGHTTDYAASRTYSIPSNLVKSGKAVITVRVLDTGGGGGFYGEAALMTLSLSNQESISLAGIWQYKIGMNLKEIPAAPKTWNDPNQPTVLYNAMINPLVPFAIKGVIWYQGESNADHAYQYRELFPLMIKDWRKQWKSDFPFYFVQLANYMPELPQPTEAAWAELREAQFQTMLHLENTGMAVTIDIGEANDLHPKNKQEVGRRLSLIARANSYNENISFSGPVYDSYRIEQNSIRITFKHVETGLTTTNGVPVKGFAIAGSNHKFHWANAVIEGNEIVVSCKDVENPVAVRYAWASNPVCNLINGAGLPASPFRTDDWMGITYSNK